jgi:rhodanese-related sulfurtransferase
MADIQDTIKTIKDKLPNVTPTPPDLHTQASAHELKARLEWGEPALTILDVRNHDSFRERHILGAMNASMEDLSTDMKDSLQPERDIYVYGATDQETTTAAKILRDAGFQRVAELKGGLADWQEIGGPVEGIEPDHESPGADAYNVASRLQDFAEEKSKEHSME